MGRIRVLSDQVANQIAAGEVVDRPASVVKELLENALDAGASRIRIEVEAGGRKLIRISDDGCGMNRDDALLAFERHATSKLRTADDLLSIATLGFRGEALPAIASVARVTLDSCVEGERDGVFGASTGTHIEINGGKMARVDEVALPRGTTISVADLFFNTPARRKFLRAESTELSHVTALVTHYALVHPQKHFELLSATHTIVSAPPVTRTAERIYQIFGKDTLGQLLPVAAELPLERAGLPEPPPWKVDPEEPKRAVGTLRISGFYSKPELQKLNRNSIYIFVNKRLIRDRLLIHGITEAYRNVIPPTSFPVVLLFLEMPPEEVDVNVHPSKTEVRFRQQTLIHDFVRDSLRTALIQSRPAAGFHQALQGPGASSSLMPPQLSVLPESEGTGEADSFRLEARELPPQAVKLDFGAGDFAARNFRDGNFTATPGNGRWTGQAEWGEAARAVFTSGQDSVGPGQFTGHFSQAESGELGVVSEFGSGLAAGEGAVGSSVGTAIGTAAVEIEQAATNLNRLGSLKPLGQLRESFIVATGEDGLWIIDQHVAHERILFEKILRERQVEQVQRQRLLMPLLVELKPWQMVVFARIAEELERNGFEVEPFGAQTLAVKAAPVGLEGTALERMLTEVIEKSSADSGETMRNEDLAALRARIAASMACHAAIKINMALDPARME
jgi:DNA mismatch repair protein MutL